MITNKIRSLSVWRIFPSQIEKININMKQEFQLLLLSSGIEIFWVEFFRGYKINFVHTDGKQTKAYNVFP